MNVISYIITFIWIFSTSLTKAQAPCLETIDGEILFGGPREVINGLSLEDCGVACLDSQDCLGAVFYPSDRQCLLYDINGRTDPDRVLPSDEDAVRIDVITDPGSCPDTATPDPGPGPGPTTGEDPRCCGWASSGECDKNPDWMKVNCQTACGTPGATLQTARSTPTRLSQQCQPTANRGSGTTLVYYLLLTQQGCYDVTRECAGWARMGECSRNSFWMCQYCQQSCGSCGTRIVNADRYLPTARDSKCGNSHVYCNFWASMRECGNNPAYMQLKCCLACSNVGFIRSIRTKRI